MKKIAKILAMIAIFALAFSFAGCKSDDSDSSDDDVTISGGSTSGSIEPIPEGFVKIPAASIDGTESWTPESKVFVSGRKLEIASFYMSDHEVTRGEYKAVMGIDPSTAKAHDKNGNELTGDDNVKNNPVNYISWYDALVYCNTRSINEGLTPCYAIGGKTDPKDWGSVPDEYSDSTKRAEWNLATCGFTANGYRLPTDAEWELAARGGKESTYTYAGSNDIDEVAWYTSNTNDTGTRDVKTKKANAYGLYDMSGNIYMNGAGTGMVAYQAERQIQARLRALAAAVYAVVIGATTPTTRRLPTGASAARTSATTSVASALFATPTSVG